MHLKDEGKRVPPKVLTVKWTSQDEVCLLEAYADEQAGFWECVIDFLEDRSRKKG
jgi:hypothetical protein